MQHQHELLHGVEEYPAMLLHAVLLPHHMNGIIHIFSVCEFCCCRFFAASVPYVGFTALEALINRRLMKTFMDWLSWVTSLHQSILMSRNAFMHLYFVYRVSFILYFVDWVSFVHLFIWVFPLYLSAEWDRFPGFYHHTGVLGGAMQPSAGALFIQSQRDPLHSVPYVHGPASLS